MKRIAIFLFVAVLTILSGSSALAYGGSTRIRVVHAVPDAAGVYVSVDNNIVLDMFITAIFRRMYLLLPELIT